MPESNGVSMEKKKSKTPLRARTVSLPNVILIAIFIAMVSFVTGSRSEQLVARLSNDKNPSNLDLSSLDELYDVLKNKYDGKLDTNKLIDGAKHGLVEATGDPYTAYFNDEEAEKFQSDLEGSFQGIGAELGKRNEQLVIISTLDDSPAKKSGLLAGDIIGKVNDTDVTGLSVEEAVTKIRGEKGTTVKLTILRSDQLKEISIMRAAITNPSVKSEITPQNVGILRISRFGETDTASLSRRAAEQFQTAGVKAVILDMRGNGGGYLEAARDIASLWLEDKVVVSERRYGVVIDELRSDNNAPLKGIKTIVLVDGGSASASEIVAGALADNGAATLVGQKTFGKGSVQTIHPVESGGQIKITVAKWYTPKGKNITKEGIKPSVEVKLTPDDINANRDPQKDKALELANQ